MVKGRPGTLHPTFAALVALGLALLVLTVTPVNAQDADGDAPSPAPEFTPFDGNPVIQRSAGGGWGCEQGTIFAPKIVKHADRFYMFFSGSCQRSGKPAAIGFATSDDGLDWTLHADNPILEPDGEGYDAMCVSIGVPILDGEQWVMYYAGNSTPCAGPGQHIGRAVADDPAGPWVRDPQPLLSAGGPGDWDEGFIMPHAVIHTETGYVMYYSGGAEYLLPLPRLIGMATSPDGVTWTKVDDPATTEPPYAASDPILDVAPDGSQSLLSVWGLDVHLTDRGWEMIFSTTCPESTTPGCPTYIGYGMSDDGLHWRTFRSRDAAILTRQHVDQPWASYCVCQPTFVKAEDEYWLYFTGCTAEANDCEIGGARGTIGWE
ncbi:MAG: hypothetical protein IT323_12315 [Anaerolineae bacterium]|nr:hypothetical protein [Anaerolineae bacterium]